MMIRMILLSGVLGFAIAELSCDPGYQDNGMGQCTAITCDPGQEYNLTQARTHMQNGCTNCTAGYYSMGYGDGCQACDYDTYQEEEGASYCYSCEPEGTLQTASTSSGNCTEVCRIPELMNGNTENVTRVLNGTEVTINCDTGYVYSKDNLTTTTDTCNSAEYNNGFGRCVLYCEDGYTDNGMGTCVEDDNSNSTDECVMHEWVEEMCKQYDGYCSERIGVYYEGQGCGDYYYYDRECYDCYTDAGNKQRLAGQLLAVCWMVLLSLSL